MELVFDEDSRYICFCELQNFDNITPLRISKIKITCDEISIKNIFGVVISIRTNNYGTKNSSIRKLFYYTILNNGKCKIKHNKLSIKPRTNVGMMMYEMSVFSATNMKMKIRITLKQTDIIGEIPIQIYISQEYDVHWCDFICFITETNNIDEIKYTIYQQGEYAKNIIKKKVNDYFVYIVPMRYERICTYGEIQEITKPSNFELEKPIGIRLLELPKMMHN